MLCRHLDHESYGGLGRTNFSQNGRPFYKRSKERQTSFNIFKRPYLSRNSIVIVPCETSIIAKQDAVIFVT